MSQVFYPYSYYKSAWILNVQSKFNIYANARFRTDEQFDQNGALQRLHDVSNLNTSYLLFLTLFGFFEVVLTLSVRHSTTEDIINYLHSDDYFIVDPVCISLYLSYLVILTTY